MARQMQQQQGFLARLFRDQTGNVLMLVAAALLPILGLIGAGVDLSRAYMAKSRLQQACDASALAGRRAMTTSSMTTSDIAEARKFFDFNFPPNSVGTTTFTPSIASKVGETTTVIVSAETTLPTVVMKIFGYTSIPIKVNCEAKFDIGNLDVMFVLDTTGSMADPINLTASGGGTTTKILALKQAVKDFYDVLAGSAASTGRIRYGFVPYSTTVNVGYLLPNNYILGGSSGETVPYQSRYPEYYYETSSAPSTCYRRYGLSTCYSTSALANAASTSSTLSANNCTKWSNNQNFSGYSGGSNPATIGTAPANTSTTTYSYDSFNGSTSAPSGSTSRKCVRKEAIVDKTYATTTTAAANTTFYRWQYAQVNHDVSQYITGASVANPAYNTAGTQDSSGNTVAATATWAGCIEERESDNTITASSSLTIPSTAYDLQIDTLPSSTATKWRPYWPQVMFNRSSSTSGTYLNTSGRSNEMACPTKARKLTVYSSRTTVPSGQTSSFDDYVNSLNPVGYTYHDIGMVWGARLLSATGMFASENSSAPNGFGINRHIVFMTDGEMNALNTAGAAWGYNKLDGRDAPANTASTTLTDIHNRRLEMICSAIHDQNVTVWVIAFNSAVSTQLDSCASSPSHVKTANDASSLTSKFQEIAQNIGGLRLTQ